jgi:hypothetical protein
MATETMKIRRFKIFFGVGFIGVFRNDLLQLWDIGFNDRVEPGFWFAIETF